MCDSSPKNGRVYVRDCIFKYLRMLEQSALVEISQAAYEWRWHISSSVDLSWINDQQKKIMNTKVIEIEYRGELVGHVEDIIPDMWQTEGDWVKGSCSLASRFESLATKLNPENIASDLKIDRVIRCLVSQGEPYMAYVISLKDNRLAFRRFSSVEESERVAELQQQSPED